MLTGFVLSERLYALCEDSPGTPALALLQMRAQNAPRSEKYEAYRYMGDVALFVGGFFNQHARSTPVGTGYYVDMGSAAYWSAYTFGGNGTMRELSNCFPVIVEALDSISVDAGISCPAPVEELVERFDRTPGSHALFQKFMGQGVIPIIGGVGKC